ncbi:MAG TPA: helix-turn-helix domain-containing protein [Conexibacter sp.]|nr:helix-turn-helix domain-containing protein [Conexibacter sp.]
MLELLLPRLKREIEARLDELRPLVAEAERLEAAKAAMLAEAEAASRAARRMPRGTLRELDVATQRNGATGLQRPAPAADDADDEAANGRAARGANQSAILAIVEERPGVSVAEIASVTKIAKPTVATTVSKMKREGLLADEAGGVKLASRQPVTLGQVVAAAPARDEGVSDEEWEAARRNAAA